MVTDNDEVKLIDFGLAMRQQNKEKMTDMCGTPAYMAPEIIMGEAYDTKVDMWSMGVLLYVLVSGYLPFQGSNREMFDKIKNARYHLNHEEFNDCSDDVKNLIK